MARITIASLTAALKEANAQLVEQGRTIEALRAQVAMLKPVDGPRQPRLPVSTEHSTQLPPVVTMRGERCYKLQNWVGGRLVTTYRPVYRGLPQEQELA